MLNLSSIYIQDHVITHTIHKIADAGVKYIKEMNSEAYCSQNYKFYVTVSSHLHDPQWYSGVSTPLPG